MSMPVVVKKEPGYDDGIQANDMEMLEVSPEANPVNAQVP